MYNKILLYIESLWKIYYWCTKILHITQWYNEQSYMSRKDTTYYKIQQQPNIESIKIKELYSRKTNSLFFFSFFFFFFFGALRVCVFRDGDLIRFLYSGWRGRTNENVIKLLVLDFLIHALQTVGFRQVGRVVVFPPGVAGKRSCLGESWQMRSTGHARVGPRRWGAPAPVRVSQHLAFTRASPETCGEGGGGNKKKEKGKKKNNRRITW